MSRSHNYTVIMYRRTGVRIGIDTATATTTTRFAVVVYLFASCMPYIVITVQLVPLTSSPLN